MKFLSKLSKETLVCSELKVKDYKELLKCSYGDNPDPLIFIETVCDILSVTTNKPSEYFKKLNVIDFFGLLLDVRINSQGTICKVVLTKEEKKANLSLRVDYIKEDLATLFQSLTTVIEHNGIEILLECPSVERLLQPAEEEYLYFIKGSYIKKEDEKKFVGITTNEQAGLLFEKLPPKVSLQIIKAFEKFIETVTKVNFLSRYGIKDQTLVFIPSLDSLIWFIKLLFSESLNVFYDNLFYLAHLGYMEASYIENSFVGEYNYFVGCLRKSLAAAKPSSDQITAEDPGHFEDNF